MNTAVPGQVVGTPGGSLRNASFAANAGVAKAGAEGERKTGAILNQLALRPGGPSVLHDLNIPNPKYSANVDHVVVSGRTVTIIDTKVWAANIYWTLGGKTFRGLKRYAVAAKGGEIAYPAEKRTLPLARDEYAKYLGIPVTDIRLGLVIWPAGAAFANFWFFKSPGDPAVAQGSALTVARAGRLFGRKPADPTLFLKLTRLVK